MNGTFRILTLAALTAALLGGRAAAETYGPANTQMAAIDFVTNFKPVTVQPTGRLDVPPEVTRAVAKKELSPILMFVLVNHMLNQSLEKVLDRIPPRFVTYDQAKQHFLWANCVMTRAWQQTMLYMNLPGFGGASGTASALAPGGDPQMTMMLFKAFSGGGRCSTGEADGYAENEGSDFNPMLLLLLTGQTAQPKAQPSPTPSPKPKYTAR